MQNNIENKRMGYKKSKEELCNIHIIFLFMEIRRIFGCRILVVCNLTLTSSYTMEVDPKSFGIILVIVIITLSKHVGIKMKLTWIYITGWRIT